MSALQRLPHDIRPSPYWADRLAGLMANAELLERCGIDVGRLVARFVDPPPHYGDPVLDVRSDRIAILTRTSGPSAAERQVAEVSERNYREARNRLAQAFGVDGPRLYAGGAA